MEYKLGNYVYHKDVYDYRESLKIVGIREKELELEGDYSGGTHNTIEKSWLSIEGVSFVYDYGYKKECREYAFSISRKDKENEIIKKLTDMILKLT